MMELVENLYCKILIDTDVSDETVAKKINSITSGEIDQWTGITDRRKIDIVENDDFDQLKRREDPDGSLFYRYYIEMEPGEDISRQNYVMNISKVLESLWEEVWKSVTACDVKDELPKKGGYGAWIELRIDKSNNIIELRDNGDLSES